jgi:hypothetical protein
MPPHLSRFQRTFQNHSIGKLAAQGPRDRPVPQSLLTGSRSLINRDAKDKVFALHTVLGRHGIFLTEPDYKRDILDIYHEATLAVMNHTRTASMLLQACSPNPSWPSWVPDLSTRVSMYWRNWDNINHHNIPGEDARFECNIPGNLRIWCSGKCQEITDCSEVFNPGSWREFFQQQLHFWRGSEDKSRTGIADISDKWIHRMALFFRALSCGISRVPDFTHQTHAWEDFLRTFTSQLRSRPRITNPTNGRGISLDRPWVTLRRKHRDRRHKAFFDIICETVGKKLCFRTDAQITGYASGSVQAGDQLVRFLGMDELMIIRKKTRSTHRLISRTLVAGHDSINTEVGKTGLGEEYHYEVSLE